MSSEKSDAIVLRVVDFSESSCVVTLLTRDFGKISAIAKGARRRKNPFEAALDLLALCRIVFLHKKSEALDILTEAKLQRRFRSAATDLKRLYAGFYSIELLLNMTDEADPNPALFDLAVETIESLDEDADPGVCLIPFQLRASRLLGHGPELEFCVGCSRNLLKESLAGGNSRIFFGLRDGGVLCRECRRAKKSVVAVNSQTMQLIRKFADPKLDWKRIQASPQEAGEAGVLLRRYVSHLLGFEPKSLKYLESVLKT